MAAGSSRNLNLTPFIDLFSVLICFLLITAVWNQIEALDIDMNQTSSSLGGNAEEGKVHLAVNLLSDQLVLTEDGAVMRYPHKNKKPDLAALTNQLRQWRQKYPERHDVVFNTDNQISYGSMIEVFDSLVGSDWGEVGISTE